MIYDLLIREMISIRRVKKQSTGKQQTRPVKNKKQMDEILYYLINKRDKAAQKGQLSRSYTYDRNYMMVLVGFNTAFRAEDLLQLRVKDLVNGHVQIKENKTGKSQLFNINKKLIEDIRAYVARNKLTENEYLFPSQRNDGIIKAISRQQGSRIMLDIKNNMHINYTFGLHSLRKTFGYQRYAETKDILTIMKMYNHDSPDVTMDYIMWTSNDAEKAREETYFGVEGKKKKH